jgi:hypothetical protein
MTTDIAQARALIDGLLTQLQSYRDDDNETIGVLADKIKQGIEGELAALDEAIDGACVRSGGQRMGSMSWFDRRARVQALGAACAKLRAFDDEHLADIDASLRKECARAGVKTHLDYPQITRHEARLKDICLIAGAREAVDRHIADIEGALREACRRGGFASHLDDDDEPKRERARLKDIDQLGAAVERAMRNLAVAIGERDDAVKERAAVNAAHTKSLEILAERSTWILALHDLVCPAGEGRRPELGTIQERTSDAVISLLGRAGHATATTGMLTEIVKLLDPTDAHGILEAGGHTIPERVKRARGALHAAVVAEAKAYGREVVDEEHTARIHAAHIDDALKAQAARFATAIRALPYVDGTINGDRQRDMRERAARICEGT